MNTLPPAIPGWQPPVRLVYPRSAVRVLSALIGVMTALVTPISVIMVLIIVTALVGADHYEGGTTGWALFAAIATTPLIAGGHLLVAVGVASLRQARTIWVATCVYVLLDWLAVYLGSVHGHTGSTGTGSWLPLIAYIGVATTLAVLGMIVVFRQEERPAS